MVSATLAGRHSLSGAIMTTRKFVSSRNESTEYQKKQQMCYFGNNKVAKYDDNTHGTSGAVVEEQYS